MIEGIIDISHHQEDVDLETFKLNGGLAVILKSTEGQSFIDDRFVSRLVEGTRLDLLMGAYHFCTGVSATSQANLFVKIAGNIPGVKLFLDVEKNPSGASVTVNLAANIATRVKQITGILPDTYTGYYQPDDTGKQWGKTGNAVLKQGGLWIARYNNKKSPEPLVPGWDTWKLWQYSDTGKVKGVSGSCDVNRFNGTEVELQEWWLS